MTSSAETNARVINQYTVQAFANKDVLIAEQRISIMKPVLYAVFTLAMLWFAIDLDTDWQYICAFLFFIGIFASVLTARQWMRPGRIDVSREKDEIEINLGKVNRVVKATEIKQFRFFHQAMQRTRSGLGGDFHMQWIVIDFKDGTDLLLLYIKSGEIGISQDGLEKEQADTLAKVIQDSLRTYVPYVQE